VAIQDEALSGGLDGTVVEHMTVTTEDETWGEVRVNSEDHTRRLEQGTCGDHWVKWVGVTHGREPLVQRTLEGEGEEGKRDVGPAKRARKLTVGHKLARSLHYHDSGGRVTGCGAGMEWAEGLGESDGRPTIPVAAQVREFVGGGEEGGSQPDSWGRKPKDGTRRSTGPAIGEGDGGPDGTG